jgi:hypothetical protein
MKKRLAIIILAVLAAILTMAAPAWAMDPPDSTPTAQFYVFRHLLEPDDWLLLIYQNIPYVSTPDEPVWQTYMWRFIDTDNITEFGAALSVSWNHNGYGYNLTSMYFNASDVKDSNMIWDTPYTLRLSGNPSNFAAPPVYYFNLATGDYSTANSTATSQAALCTTIKKVASDLDVVWALGVTYSLLNETESGTVLSIYGESFFRSAIYGLQGLCPQVFAYVIADINLTERTFGSNYAMALEDQYTGTWVQTAKDAGKALFGTNYDLTAIIFSILGAIVIGVCSIMLSGDAWHGIADARTGLIAATRLGFFGLGFLGMLAAIAVLYGASRLWGVFR